MPPVGDFTRVGEALSTGVDLGITGVALSPAGDLGQTGGAFSTAGDLGRMGVALSTAGDWRRTGAALSTAGDFGRTGVGLSIAGDLGRTASALFVDGDLGGTGVTLSTKGSFGGTEAALLIRGDFEGRGASLSTSTASGFEQQVGAMLAFIFELGPLTLFETGSTFAVAGTVTASVFVGGGTPETASSGMRLTTETSLFGSPLAFRSTATSEECSGLSGISGGFSKELDELEDSTSFAFASLASK